MGLVFSLIMLGARPAQAADGTWTNAAGGSWGTAGNWAGGTIADGAGALADFSTVDLTANRTITLDTSRNIGRLSFRDANWTNTEYSWTLTSTPGSILTLNNMDGPGGNPPTIAYASGGNSISTVLAGSNGLNISLPWSNYDSTHGTGAAGIGGLEVSETTARLIFYATNTVSGALTVKDGGRVQTYGTVTNFGKATSLVLSGNSVFQNGDGTSAKNNGVGNRIGDGTATLSLGGASGAGTFTMAFPAAANTHAQTFAGLTVNAGQNVLNTVGAVAGTLNLTFTGTGGAGYVRNTNGLVNVASAAGFNPQFATAPTALGGSSVSGTADSGDEILIGAILGGSNFITAASGNLGAATYVTTLTAGKNVNVTNALSTSGNLSINSLRLGDTTQRTLTIGASHTLTLASGGILLPSSMTTQNINHTITGGNLMSGQCDLWIYSASGSTGVNNGNGDPRQARYAATIASKITGAISLTVGGGTAQVLLSGANDYTGGTYLQNGFIALSADSGLGADSGAVTAVSGLNSIQPTVDNIIFNASRNFVINSGAQLQIGDLGSISSTIAGQVSGGGQLEIGYLSLGQRLVLTNNNSGFTGQYLVNGYLRADDGVGLSTNANLILCGPSKMGVLETSGTFTRALGSGAGQVQWQNDAFGCGGFAAVGGALTVNLGGNATPDALTWGSGYFVPFASPELVLGDGASTHDVTFENQIALSSAQRSIRVDAASTTKAIISGVLSGNASSGITKQGTGTLVLTGDNTFLGPTTIIAGTLQIGNGTTDGSIASSSAITNLATLAFNTASSQIYSNSIVSTNNPANGKVLKVGAGTLTLSGANGYSGTTTISNGVLAVGNNLALSTNTVVLAGGGLGAAAGTWAITNVVNVQAASSLGASGTLILMGSITNNGALTKTGSGAVLINGSKTGTNWLAVTVGTLGGTGTVAGVVTNLATITAGDTNYCGTLTLSSNLVMGAGSAFLGEYNASTSDVVSVSRQLTAGANCTVTLNPLGGVTPPPTRVTLFTYVTLVNAANLATWTVTGSDVSKYRCSVSYDASSVYVDIARRGTTITLY
jgi:autotransporter-associated beta strand protein